MANRSRDALNTRAKRGFRGYPILTLAYYGPDDQKATKVAVGITRSDTDEEAEILDRFIAEGTVDVRIDERICKRIVDIIRQYPGCSVVMADRIIGCPHEAGIDYPEDDRCPECTWWHGRDRWTGELLSEPDSTDPATQAPGGKPILLSVVLDGLDMLSNESTVFLDRELGEVVHLMNDDLCEVEDGEEPDEDASEWEIEAFKEANDVLHHPDRFVRLPSKYDIHEWEMMRRYASDIEDEDAREALLNAIHGSGAFRMFRSVTDHLGLRDAWFIARRAYYREIAVEWCEENHVPFTDDAEEKGQ